MKSSLNFPLKFLILLWSSSRPREAIEVAVCSEYCLEAISTAFCKALKLWCGARAVSTGVWGGFCGKFGAGLRGAEAAYYGIRIFLLFCV